MKDRLNYNVPFDLLSPFFNPLPMHQIRDLEGAKLLCKFLILMPEERTTIIASDSSIISLVSLSSALISTKKTFRSLQYYLWDRKEPSMFSTIDKVVLPFRLNVKFFMKLFRTSFDIKSQSLR